MGPAYFVIAIMGCGDAGTACQPVAMPATHYATEQACMAARGDALMANSDLDFPTLLAQCVPGAHKASAAERDSRDVDAKAA